MNQTNILRLLKFIDKVSMTISRDGRSLDADLIKYFGADSVVFKPGQKEIIESVLANNNTLGILPTGGGKSLCFQLPVYLGVKPTIVVSPLIALMLNQVESLNNGHVKSDYLNSMKTFAEQDETIKRFINAQVDILYVSPEKLTDDFFVNGIVHHSKKKPILFVIDEAHCISDWGHDFRPDYLAIPSFLSHFDKKTVLALTATASEKTRKEISEILSIPNKSIFHKFDTYRENLQLSVKTFSSKDDKDSYLETILLDLEKPGLIYTSGREISEKFSKYYAAKGYRASYYHADLKNKDKETIIRKFINREIDFVFCTNAFGMGIDIPFIRFVIHYRIPSSLDQYIQEIGRAGRDNKKSNCILLFLNEDVGLQKRLITSNIPKHDEVAKYAEDLLDTFRKDGIKKLTKYSGDVKEVLVAKQLIANGHLSVIGDLINEIEISNQTGMPLDKYSIKDDSIIIRQTAKINDVEEKQILEELYNMHFANKISIISRSDIHTGYRIINQQISDDTIEKIDKHFNRLKDYKNSKLQEIVEYASINDIAERRKTINEYFKLR